MYRTSATIGSTELDDLFGPIDAGNIDFHDEPPHVRLTSVSVTPKGGVGSISLKPVPLDTANATEPNFALTLDR
jgi:hypothetical protein